MNHPKLLFALSIAAVLTANISFAQDTTKKAPANDQIFAAIEQVPVFPGGYQAFGQYIGSNLKYPEIARLIGLQGKVFVSFVVDKDGTVTDVKPVKCLGAGCESEAVRVISMSPKWTPGVQDGKQVRVAYTIPIDFSFQEGYTKTTIKSLRNSNYGFVFYIKSKTYTLDEAEAILGKSFDPSTITTVENYDNPKYAMPEKKGVYLIVMKDS